MDKLKNIEKNKAAQKLNRKKGRFHMRKGVGSTIAIVLSIVMIFASILLFADTVSSGAKVLADSYTSEYRKQKDITYQDKYDAYKNAAEEKFHVSNRVSIYIGSLKEEEKLEVLKVSDVEFVIEDKDDNDGNVISWLEVPGEGAFVVDLKAGEYIVDNERAHVLVRVPYPELANITVDYANVQKLLFKDDFFQWQLQRRRGSGKKAIKSSRNVNPERVCIKSEFLSECTGGSCQYN